MKKCKNCRKEYNNRTNYCNKKCQREYMVCKSRIGNERRVKSSGHSGRGVFDYEGNIS